MVRPLHKFSRSVGLSSFCTWFYSMLLGYLLVLWFHETPESKNIIWYNIISLLVNLDLVECICIIGTESAVEVVLLHNSLLSTILVISSRVRNRLRFPMTISSGVNSCYSIAFTLSKIIWRLRLVVIGIIICQSARANTRSLIGGQLLVYLDVEIIDLLVNLLFFDVLGLHFLFSNNN